MTAKEDFDAAVRGTNEWIDNLKLQLGWQDRERVYAVLLATLHALRDCLPRDEAIYLAAELPALLRGFYYTGWHPGARKAPGSRSAFLERIHDGGIAIRGSTRKKSRGRYSLSLQRAYR